MRAELCPRCGVRQMMSAPPQPQYAPHQVVVVGGEKSVGTAVLLALLFGPLGMIYSTGVGALVMFLANILVIVGTAGVGLIITVPVCAIWAANAVNTHNARIRQQAAMMIRY
ncbi:MAG: hypothetical protein ABI591_08350 [Kofleriaceae bacterium]